MAQDSKDEKRRKPMAMMDDKGEDKLTAQLSVAADRIEELETKLAKAVEIVG